MAGAIVLAAVGCAALSSAAPLPPVSGDWVIDPAEVVNVTAADLTVDGNITLNTASELHLVAVRLVFADLGGKRSVIGPLTSVVTIEASTVSSQLGPAAGGGGYFFHVDGTLTINGSSITGLAGPQVPLSFAETEGLHLTSSSSFVTNCTISGAQGYAITVTPFGATITPRISDNLIQNSGGGVFVLGLVIVASNAVIERNSFSFNTLPHIVVAGSNPRIAENSFFGSTAGVTILAGSPTVERNSFVANLLGAVVVQGGGGLYTENTITASGAAFQFTGASATVRNNTATLTATFLQAVGSTVACDDNRATGAFGTALAVNGSTLTGHGNVMESALGSAALTATNGSTVRLTGGSLRATGASAVFAEGGSVALVGVTVSGSPSAVQSVGALVALTDTNLTGTGSAPAVSLRGGSLSVSGGTISGGSDGVLLDAATSDFAATAIHGNAGWGIHSIHYTPSLSSDEIGSLINGNGAGDLLVEADLTVLVRNPALEPLANASISIRDVRGGGEVTGLTGLDGRAGPVRLQTVRVDSLNNEVRSTPYALRATFAGGYRASGSAALVADQEVELILRLNALPTVNLTAPDRVVVGGRFTATAVVDDADADPLEVQWSTDDGRVFAAAAINLSFDSPGAHTLALWVSDGYANVTQVHNVTVRTLEEANRRPEFGALTQSVLLYDRTYEARVTARDPDGDVVALWARTTALGVVITISSGTAASAVVQWSPWIAAPRSAVAQDFEFNLTFEAWDGLASSYLNVALLLHVPGNEAPRITAPASVAMDSGTVVTVDVSGLVSDLDDSVWALRFTATARSAEANGSAPVAVFLAYGANGSTVLYIMALPVTSASGAIVTIRVSDTLGASAAAEFNVTVGRSKIAAPSGTGDIGALLLPTLLAAAAIGLSVMAIVLARHDRKVP